jgi:hypothetical protein
MKVIRTNGTVEELEDTSLKGMQDAVGGLIEIVQPLVSAWNGFPIDGHVLIANEEGLLIGLPYNEYASLMAGRHIVGDVILSSREDLE